MNIELSILDWIQTLHTPFLDKIMVFITRLGDAGIIWIVLSIVLLLIPKTRKSGAVMVAALVVDVLLCNIVLKNLVARTRPYDVNTGVHLLVAKLHDYSFPSGHTAASFASVTALYLAGEKKLWKFALVLGMSDRNIEVISVCTLSDRCSWRNSVRCDFRIFGISQSIEMKMTKDYRPGIIWKSVGISIILHEFYKNSSLRR